MPELKVVTVRTDELVPYAGNAKLHPHEQIDQIAQSIKEFGNNDPIAVWHNEQGELEIVEGHGRLLALNKLGIKEAPVIFLDHLSDNQRRAYTHIHNQLTMNTGFDAEILKEELGRLDGFDMGVYGFDVGTEISSEDWTEQYDENDEEESEGYEEPEDYGENDFDREETFHCLFVYHTEEEEQKLKGILGVTKLETAYEMGDLT
jgi:hypothetical protein